MREFTIAIAGVLGMAMAIAAGAQAGCPNQSLTATVPMTGENVVTVYDSATCNPLAGPFTMTTGAALGVFATPMTTTTKPAVSIDPPTSATPGVLRFTANGAPFGTKVTAFATFGPDTSKVSSIVLTVGGPVTGLVFGTPTP